MKITRDTPTLFIAHKVPWVIAIALFGFTMAFVTPGVLIAFQGIWAGLLFAAFGGGLGFLAMCFFVERLMLRLDAEAGLVTLRRLTILKSRTISLPLDKLLEAGVQDKIDRDDGKRLSRPVLHLTDGTSQPITEIYSSGSGAARLADSVNRWLQARTAQPA